MGAEAASICICGASREKSGDLSSSAACTAVLLTTLEYAGDARRYSRLVISHNVREMASRSSANGSGPEVIPDERFSLCVLSSTGLPTRIVTSAQRRFVALDVTIVPYVPAI